MDLPEPRPGKGEATIQVIGVGVDGTDDELVSGAMGRGQMVTTISYSAMSVWVG